MGAGGAWDLLLPPGGLPLLGALAALGLLLWVAWTLGRAVGTHLLAARGWGVELATYGPWAVVTGATSGIGRAYAHELAKRGLNVVLISRSLQKLKQVAAEIEEQHGRSTRVIETDFTQGPEIYESIQTALQSLEIGILVNNVGMACATGLVNFLDVPNIDKVLSDIVNCNMLSVAKMTRIVLPQMLTRYKRQERAVPQRLGSPVPGACLMAAKARCQPCVPAFGCSCLALSRRLAGPRDLPLPPPSDGCSFLRSSPSPLPPMVTQRGC
ncbi:very-long-chain 3-oxoacyl-CoA reductase-like [Emydura macquarii macquarii]|uniref:very-long-chain 3-oxoacyl-CoA reductase-like n=1 Tax=Emydura macquarii macquarii TaxID=1129001 RepID=UPI003529E885